uniref:Uncharacterized protein n=1 Tax=Rhizophora mucronata TaxID=61149 RepID=A0A2P2PDZ6_RHIMU
MVLNCLLFFWAILLLMPSCYYVSFVAIICITPIQNLFPLT